MRWFRIWATKALLKVPCPCPSIGGAPWLVIASTYCLLSLMAFSSASRLFWLMTVPLTLAAAVVDWLHAESPNDATAVTTRKGERRRFTVPRIVVKRPKQLAIARFRPHSHRSLRSSEFSSASLRVGDGRRLFWRDELGEEVGQERGHVGASGEG